MEIKSTSNNIIVYYREYIDIFEATKEAMWMKGLALEMDIAHGIVKIYSDS